MERYFLLMHMNEQQMLVTTIIGLDGDALTWFQWENQRQPITSWVNLKQQLLRFRSLPVGSVSEKMLSVTQLTTVQDYRHRWELLASRVPDVPDHVLEGSFVRGLKESVKVAQRIEEGHQLLQSGQPIRIGLTKQALSPI